MSYRIGFVFCLLALICIAPAQALLLTPGNFVNTLGTTSAARPELAGTVIADVIRPLEIDLGAGLIFKGSVQDRVVREDVAGTLDFYYRITNDANSNGYVDFVTRKDFSGFATDVDFRTDGLGSVGTNQASRSADGKEVLFDYFAINTIDPGLESFSFFIKTDAKSYGPGQGAVAIGGGRLGITLAFDSFQPVVPEPCTLALLAPLGLIAACRYRRQRRRPQC